MGSAEAELPSSGWRRPPAAVVIGVVAGLVLLLAAVVWAELLALAATVLGAAMVSLAACVAVIWVGGGDIRLVHRVLVGMTTLVATVATLVITAYALS